MLRSVLAWCSFLGIITLLVVSSQQQSLGQLTDRSVPFPEWSATPDDTEVVLELVAIRVANRPIQLGSRFLSDDNWLKEMKLSIKNVSQKNIVSFALGGGLLEGLDQELEPNQSFQYGIGWGWKAGPHTKYFRPGEILELDYSNVDDLSTKVLAKLGEGGFRTLKFMAPSIRFKKGDAGLSPKMRFNH